MALLPEADWRAAEAIARIGHCNPFLPERLELERMALGPAFCATGPIICLPPGADTRTVFPNTPLLAHRAEQLVLQVQKSLLRRRRVTDHEQRVYRDLVLYLLYARQLEYFDGLLSAQAAGQPVAQKSSVWTSFRRDFANLLELPGLVLPPHYQPEHCFAIFLQLQQAFSRIFECIIGRSMPIARLRAAVWQSIFTCDMERYTRLLFRTIGQLPTLITGASGTGKELVARAIGQSRYIPFDPRTAAFPADAASPLSAVNLSALASTLIESELFGHRKGAFTGAVADRKGWFEVTGACGTVFLDEIGELDQATQVKLLRLLQSRSFSRVGETETRQFQGKLVAATNRDLVREMAEGRFREDLYYRLCADQIQTPSLREQVADRPDDLRDLAEFISLRLLGGDKAEAAQLAGETSEWIAANLGSEYAWPGNIRELEQCVSNVLIRRSYRPASVERPEDSSPRNRLAQAVRDGQLTLAELTEQYVSMIYAAEHRYDRAAERLGIDWRTLKQKLSPDLVRRFSGPADQR